MLSKSPFWSWKQRSVLKTISPDLPSCSTLAQHFTCVHQQNYNSVESSNVHFRQHYVKSTVKQYYSYSNKLFANWRKYSIFSHTIKHLRSWPCLQDMRTPKEFIWFTWRVLLLYYGLNAVSEVFCPWQKSISEWTFSMNMVWFKKIQCWHKTSVKTGFDAKIGVSIKSFYLNIIQYSALI